MSKMMFKLLKFLIKSHFTCKTQSFPVFSCIIAAWLKVDNSLLESSAAGVCYRSSMDLGAVRKRSRLVEWDSFVEGNVVDKEWLKVEEGYLPLRIRGIPILQLQTGLQKFMNEKNIQQCPTCRQGIEKKKGCDHMTCKCGAQFCYICGADYLGPRGIFAVGNHVHEKFCKHYRAFPWFQIRKVINELFNMTIAINCLVGASHILQVAQSQSVIQDDRSPHFCFCWLSVWTTNQFWCVDWHEKWHDRTWDHASTNKSGREP